MAIVLGLYLMFLLSIMAWILWRCSMKSYMMKNHPDKYMEMKERDSERMRTVGSELGKAAAPLLMKLAERMLKK